MDLDGFEQKQIEEAIRQSLATTTTDESFVVLADPNNTKTTTPTTLGDHNQHHEEEAVPLSLSSKSEHKVRPPRPASPPVGRRPLPATAIPTTLSSSSVTTDSNTNKDAPANLPPSSSSAHSATRAHGSRTPPRSSSPLSHDSLALNFASKSAVMVYCAGHVVLQTQLNGKGIDGQLIVSENVHEYFVAWSPYPGSSGPSQKDKEISFNYSLKDIASFRRNKSKLFVALSSGGYLPPLEFPALANLKQFLAFMEDRVGVMQSRNDAYLYFVRPGEHMATALHELGFNDNNSKTINKSKSNLKETLTDIKWTFLEGLSRVAHSLLDPTSDRTLQGESRPVQDFPVLPVTFPVEDENLQVQERADGDLGSFEVLEKIPTSLRLAPPETRTRGLPLSQTEWSAFISSDIPPSIDSQRLLREKIFYGGIDPLIRKEVWLYLLGVNEEALGMTKAERVAHYETLTLQWSTISEEQRKYFAGMTDRMSRVNKDVVRTDRDLPYFGEHGEKNLQALANILMAYVMSNFDLGYVQGMSDLAALLLHVIDDEVDAFYAFRSLMVSRAKYFSENQLGMKDALTQLAVLIRFIDPEFMDYLEAHNSGELYFCYRWILVLFKREFIYDDIKVLWDAFFSEFLSPSFELFVCVAIMRFNKDAIVSQNYGLDEILVFVNRLAQNLDVKQCLIDAEAWYRSMDKAGPNIPESVRRLFSPFPAPKQEGGSVSAPSSRPASPKP